MTDAFKVGDAVEYEDDYTHETVFGRVTAAYGNEFIIQKITKGEAGPKSEEVQPEGRMRV